MTFYIAYVLNTIHVKTWTATISKLTWLWLTRQLTGSSLGNAPKDFYCIERSYLPNCRLEDTDRKITVLLFVIRKAQVKSIYANKIFLITGLHVHVF